MTESTKRALRTIVQLIVAAAIYIPIIVPMLPADLTTGEFTGVLAGLVVWSGVITKAWNFAEERGWVPTWLKSDPLGGITAADVVAAVAELKAAQSATAELLEELKAVNRTNARAAGARRNSR